MNAYLVFSLLGADRTGLVDQLSNAVTSSGGNLEEARMAALGSEFAVMMLVRVDTAQREALEKAVRERAETLQMSLQIKETRPPHEGSARHDVTVCVTGADHEGIVHPVVNWLAAQGCSIVNLASHVSPAPHTGTMLFTMTLQVVAPSALSRADMQRGLTTVGDRLNVDVDVTENASLVRQEIG